MALLLHRRKQIGHEDEIDQRGGVLLVSGIEGGREGGRARRTTFFQGEILCIIDVFLHPLSSRVPSLGVVLPAAVVNRSASENDIVATVTSF